MVIDAHCHIYPDRIADKAAHATGRFYTLPTTYDGTLSELLEAGAKAGIDRFVVQSVATTPHQVSSINHFIAASVAAYPDKLYGLGTLHPDSEDQEADVRAEEEAMIWPSSSTTISNTSRSTITAV